VIGWAKGEGGDKGGGWSRGTSAGVTCETGSGGWDDVCDGESKGRVGSGSRVGGISWASWRGGGRGSVGVVVVVVEDVVVVVVPPAAVVVVNELAVVEVVEVDGCVVDVVEGDVVEVVEDVDVDVDVDVVELVEVVELVDVEELVELLELLELVEDDVVVPVGARVPSRIVTTPSASRSKTSLSLALRTTLKVSGGSTTASARTLTSIGLVSSPTAKRSVPVALM
jgi:hypothetical protein